MVLTSVAIAAVVVLLWWNFYRRKEDVVVEEAAEDRGPPPLPLPVMIAVMALVACAATLVVTVSRNTLPSSEVTTDGATATIEVEDVVPSALPPLPSIPTVAIVTPPPLASMGDVHIAEIDALE
jgi:hypothetical protein